LVKDEIGDPMGLRTLALLDGGDREPQAPYHLSRAYGMDTSTARVFPNELLTHEDPSWKALGGGFQIDAPDLARFGWLTLTGGLMPDAVRDGRLWLADTLPQWTDTTTTYNSAALGWEARTLGLAGASRRAAEHAGTATGARNHVLVLRDDRLVVAVLTNQRHGPGTTRHRVSPLARQLAGIVLSAPSPPP
jgi:CubicO group peptidase (beta-lactamase class C family)